MRRIKRINANDLSWYAYSDYVFGNGFTSDILPKSGTKAYCNIAKVNYPMTNDWAEFCFTGVTSTSDCHLNVRDTTTFPTITEWNTYIGSKYVYFDYPLANPTFEPFADQTLPYLSTYDGVTNISNDDALSAEMTVKYPTTDASGAGSRNESRIAELDNNKIDKSSIVTSLNSASTDEQVASAKVVYDNAIKDKNLKTYTKLSQLGLTEGSETLSDIATNMENNSMLILNVSASSNVSEYPVGYGVLVVSKLNINRVSFIFTETSGGNDTLRQWFASYNGGKINVWQRVCATTVADVAKTTITFSDETKYSIVNNNCMYFVKNGICTMQIYVTCNTPVGAWATVSTDLPKPSGFPSYGMLSNPTGNECVNYVVNTSGVLQLKNGTTGINYIGTFSYPVAES